MRAGLFWLNDRQWDHLKPHLPRGLTGPRRGDDRRIISGIIHMLQSGARWRDCPREYGPYTTIYNRFNRWSKRDRWRIIFEALARLGKDIAAAPDVLALAPDMSALLADKGYDGDGLRAQIVKRGAKPVIPNKSNRVRIHRFDKRAYRGRNVIERCFCRLKDFRRVATRYDKLAGNFLSAVQLAALVTYWL